MRWVNRIGLLLCSCLMAGQTEVLDYWFGDLEAEPYGRADVWFHGGEAVDREIEALFGEEMVEAAAGRLDHWGETPKGRMALLILLDQFPRNVYRERAEAFATDPQALHHALCGIREGQDLQLHPVERLFFYLPLQHSESLGVQQFSVELYRELGNPQSLDYALRHRDIIARFGRFPHRNAPLGRSSTPDEERFLQEPGSSF